MVESSIGKVRKIEKKDMSKKYLKGNILLGYKSINSLSIATSINFDSLRRVNVLTTPLATIWQLSKAFSTTIEDFLSGISSNYNHKELKFNYKSQTFLPLIPQEHFFEFIINPIKFLSEQPVFFFTHPEVILNPLSAKKIHICTFLKETPPNKTLHRLAIIELDTEYIPIKNEDVIFKHPKYHSLIFGKCFTSGNTLKIATKKRLKKEIFDLCDIKIFGRVLSTIEAKILSTERFSFKKLLYLGPSTLQNKKILTKTRKDCSRVFFENVAKILKDQKIPLNQLSRAIGKNVSILRDAKKNQRSVRIDTALNIARYLNTSIDSLLYGLEESKPAIIAHEKICKDSDLISLTNWADFEKEAFSEHKIFSIPKLKDATKAFAIKNNLEKSFINGFRDDAIFVVFSGVENLKKAKYLMLQEGHHIKISKVLHGRKIANENIIIDGQLLHIDEIKKQVLGEVVCVFSQS